MAAPLIGVHVHAQPERLADTLAALRAHTEAAHRLVLLPDGPDAPTRAFLATTDLPTLATARPQGAAACFNRLAASGADAPLVVLLESGSVVGPGWLTALRAALNADDSNGLAGPSTNRAGNEQAAFPDRLGDLAAVARTAADARRARTVWRPLDRLHNVADFCLAARREVIEAVGAADEGYGMGPCWEMEYAARAARVGWRSVWARRAYVWRAPITQRRRRAEGRLFEASKRRYQDALCGLRLRGEASGYESHCLGEACEHFAPRSLVQIHRALPEAARPEAARRATRPRLGDEPDVPLITCIMPTAGRPDYVLQSVRYFLRQDYPAKELIIVDDAGGDLAGRLPDDPRIRYEQVPARWSIGRKRNHAVHHARGEIVAHWDDDDWHAPSRLRVQSAPLLAGAADVTGLHGTVFFELDRWRFWRASPALHRRLFVLDVLCGALVYRRSLWGRARYPDSSLAEDAAFLRTVVRRGARLHRIENDGLYLYLRHGTNSWRFACGAHVDARGWSEVDASPLPEADRRFYAARSASGPEARPLVSAVMLTANRRPFVPHAVRQFLRQDYPRCELVVVDDGPDAVGDLLPDDPRIRHVRLGDGPRRIGTKRNLGAEAARGEILAHWDDDDWYAPDRLRAHVEVLDGSGALVSGVDAPLFWAPVADRAWRYAYPPDGRPWVHGATLAYRREAWERRPFQDVQVGEDSLFVWGHARPEVVAVDEGVFVGIVHAGNTSPKRTGGRRWHPADTATVHARLGADAEAFGDLLQGGARRPSATAQTLA